VTTDIKSSFVDQCLLHNVIFSKFDVNYHSECFVEEAKDISDNFSALATEAIGDYIRRKKKEG